MIDTAFEPDRLRLARELKAWSQTRLASEMRVSSAALSQFESGAATPSAATRARLADLLDVPSSFFSAPIEATHEGFFRSLRRTSVADRRKARAVAHIVHDMASLPDAAAELPRVDVPRLHVPLDADRETVESVANEVRDCWTVAPGPLDSVVALLEAHGVIVMRLPPGFPDVDAFSLPFEDRPVVVLGSDKGDRGRSRFDAAHELGHLVLHGDQVWGLKEVEDQAHWFAAALLMPAADIANRLPQRVDWPQLFALKHEWQVSLAALLMRARSLGRMEQATYLSAIKIASARGWRRTEPVPLGAPERPANLPRLLRSNVGRRLAVDMPPEVIRALAEANAA
jgi:Zn-dependent peptidase ImmA (M78 family)/transcriptional regulator with XRE-family HTH domain